MADGGGHVVGGAGLAPAVDELAGTAAEAGAHVRVTEGEDRAGLVDALGHDKLEVAVLVLRDGQIGHIAHRRVELGQVAAAGLAVEHGHNLHGRLSGRGDVGVAGAGVADDADVLIEVDGVHLAQLAAARNGLEDGHGHRDLDVALDGAGRALLDEHRERGDQHRVQLTGHALGEAVVVAGDEGDLLVPDPLLKCDNVAGHIPDLLHRAAALNIEGVQNVLRLGTDGVLVGDVVGDGPHLLPVKLLGVEPHTVVQVRLIDVQIHHTGVRAADLRKVRITEAAAHLRGLAPVVDFGLHGGVTALDNAGDDGVALTGALQISDHLADSAAGVQLTQPGGGVGVGVVGGLLLLHVDEDDGHVEVAHGGQHIVRGSVGQQLQNDKVNVGGAELIARGHGLLLGGDDAAVDDLDGVGQRLFEGGVLALKLGDQRGELRQVSAQRNGEHANAGFGFD